MAGLGNGGLDGRGDLGIGLELLIILQLAGLGRDSNINRLVLDGLSGAVDLDSLDDVCLRANALQSVDTLSQSIGDLFLLGTQCLQVSQFCQMFLIVSHSSFPPKFSVIYSP